MMNMLLTAPAIDTSVIAVIGDIATEILSLFTIFPINVFLTISIVGVVTGIVLKLKHS
ncbi:MAG: hypothetical protein K0S61_4875 [Anaerocolumna sp.]|nr:hypothetical protein [Anaerocolumna sp.]